MEDNKQRSFLEKLYELLAEEYPKQLTNNEPTRDNYREIDRYESNPIHISFQRRPRGSLRFEWALDKNGEIILSKLEKNEIAIRDYLGDGKGQKVTFKRSEGSRRNIWVEYAGTDFSDEALIAWALPMYGKFKKIIKEYYP